MALKSRVKKLEQFIQPNSGILTRDDWTFEERMLYFSNDCPQEIKDKHARTDWTIPSKNTKKLEDFM
jgi:hypothetical protein